MKIGNRFRIHCGCHLKFAWLSDGELHRERAIKANRAVEKLGSQPKRGPQHRREFEAAVEEYADAFTAYNLWAVDRNKELATKGL